jgi:uncharacterized oligopeptide transporter (OPT) family protein
MLWSLGVAFFGVFFAVPLRKQTIIREKLRFPSGTATAQMISLLHQQPDPTATTTSSAPSSTTLALRKRPYRQNDDENDDQYDNSEQPLLSSSSSPSVNTSTTVQRSSSPSSYGTSDDLSITDDGVSNADFEDSWHLKLKALLVSFSLSSLYTLLSYFFPIITNLPIFNWLCFNLVDFRAWDWYFAPSLSYVGQGIIMVSCQNGKA